MTIQRRLEAAEKAVDETKFPQAAEEARLRLLMEYASGRPGAAEDWETVHRHMRSAGREPRHNETDLLNGQHEEWLERLT